jgi:hypothetical protein
MGEVSSGGGGTCVGLCMVYFGAINDLISPFNTGTKIYVVYGVRYAVSPVQQIIMYMFLVHASSLGARLVSVKRRWNRFSMVLA